MDQSTMEIVITFLTIAVVLLLIGYVKEMSTSSKLRIKEIASNLTIAELKMAHKKCIDHIANLSKNSYGNGTNNFTNDTDQNGINN